MFSLLLVTVIMDNQGYLGMIYLIHYSGGLFPLIPWSTVEELLHVIMMIIKNPLQVSESPGTP